MEKERKEKEKREKERKEKIEKEKQERIEKEKQEKIEKERKEKIEKEKQERLEKERKKNIRNERKENIEKERKDKNEKEKRRRFGIEKNKQKEIEKEKNEKIEKERKNKSDNDDDIFSEPIKIIYVPKKVNSYIQTKNKSYLKKIARDKKTIINDFIKLLYKKCYSLHYPFLMYHLKILEKLNFIQNRLRSLKNIFSIIEKQKLKKALKKYREKILNEKVKEEILKKNINLLLIINKDENNDDKYKNKPILKSNSKIKGNPYELNDVIIENENEDEFNSIEEKIVLRGKRKFLSKRNADHSLLNKIVNKKIDLEKKHKYNLLNKYFKKWYKNTIMTSNHPNSKISCHLHSPDMEIRKKSKKKHIRVKINRAITSKTSLGSMKSEGKVNTSSILPSKKMRIKNVIVDSSAHLTTSLLNDSNLNVNNEKAINLSLLLDKIDNKNLIYRFFKYWKKK